MSIVGAVLATNAAGMPRVVTVCESSGADGVISRAIATLSPMQNADGGFGGGQGQMSHSAASYAAVLTLALVGGHEALGIIDRKAMWKWLGDLKQLDGGFSVCCGGEEDVRGAYCAMVMISLLNLPLQLPPNSLARMAGAETFLTGLPEYLSRCESRDLRYRNG